jgi:transcriptional regulator with XRE-family HTH domain
MTETQLGRVMKERREELGLSQARAAARGGLDPSTWNQVETGARRPTTPTLEKIAAALDFELADLFRGYAAPKVEPRLPFNGYEELGQGPPPQSISEALEQAGAKTKHLALPTEEFERLWTGKSVEHRARINQELLEERRLIRPRINQWTSMTSSKERSRLSKLWREVFTRMLTAVVRNEEAAEIEAEAARQAGDEERAANVLKEAGKFADAA